MVQPSLTQPAKHLQPEALPASGSASETKRPCSWLGLWFMCMIAARYQGIQYSWTAGMLRVGRWRLYFTYVRALGRVLLSLDCHHGKVTAVMGRRCLTLKMEHLGPHHICRITRECDSCCCSKDVPYTVGRRLAGRQYVVQLTTTYARRLRQRVSLTMHARTQKIITGE